jgi:hypothetical protein
MGFKKGKDMKSRSALSIIISVLIASALLGSYAGYTAASANPTHGFTLSVKGTAYDPQKQVDVSVTLSVVGTANGKLKIEINLYVKGGDIFVDHGYGTFSVSQGTGELVFQCHYIALYIWVTPKYGGKVALWCLEGRTGTLSGQTLGVSLSGTYLILPTKGYPRLDNLSLSGTITPVY